MFAPWSFHGLPLDLENGVVCSTESLTVSVAAGIHAIESERDGSDTPTATERLCISRELATMLLYCLANLIIRFQSRFDKEFRNEHLDVL